MFSDLTLGPLLQGQTMVHWLCVSCLFGGYKFASVFRCVGLVRTCKNPWPLNLLQVTNLTFGPCFKWGRHTKIVIYVIYWPLALDLTS